MRVFSTVNDLNIFIEKQKKTKKKIGFVPTMGALHAGHISLFSKALSENDIVVASIFVNPTQFNNATDLESYPRTLDKDIELLKKTSEDIVVFTPLAQDLYNGVPKTIAYNFFGIENEMEGKYRPGHFNGVGTVLKLLFEVVSPNRAYFGEKDFQQLQIVKKLVEIESFSIQIIGCPIYRETDGLAFSSRNKKLTKKQHQQAKLIFETLLKVKKEFGIKSVKELNEMVKDIFKNHKLFNLEYFEIANVKDLKTLDKIDTQVKCRAFIAVFADQVRLIDNIALN